MISNKINSADFYFTRGKDDYIKGDYQNCIRDLVYAQELYNSIGNKEKAAETLFILANAYYKIEHFAQARQMFTQAYTRYKEVNNLKKLGECSFFLGELFRNEGEFNKGKRFLAEAIEIFSKLKDLERLADTWKELANISQISLNMVSDHPSHPINSYKTAINLYKKIKNNRKKAETELDLGQLLISHSKFDEALKFLSDSLAYYAKQKDYNNIITISILIGKAYFELGKKPKAREYMYKAIEQMRKAEYSPEKVGQLKHTIFSLLS
ncbi:MAG: tetratricopeptide repeat protein [Candidatus Heimdallarchaeaceae archaeon]